LSVNLPSFRSRGDQFASVRVTDKTLADIPQHVGCLNASGLVRIQRLGLRAVATMQHRLAIVDNGWHAEIEISAYSSQRQHDGDAERQSFVCLSQADFFIWRFLR